MEDINPNEVYTTKETRDFLKVSESTLKRYLKKGIIRAHKIGGRYRILGSEILLVISPEVESKVYQAYKGVREKARKTIERW